MRVILLTFIVVLSISCEKQEIKPMFAKKSLAELHGDGQTMNFTIKVPLTQDTLSFYDASSVLEDSSLDEEDPGLIKDIYNSLKYSIFNLGLNMGMYNKLKLSFATELPKVDTKYLKSLRVKKIFFAIENCEKGDAGCKTFKKSRPANLKLLEKFFVNVSAIEDMNELRAFSDQDPMLEEEEFEVEAEKAFSMANNKSFNPSGDSLNIARFNADTEYRKKQKLDTSVHKTGILRLRSDLSKASKLELIRELKDPEYKGIIKSFSTVGRNVYVEMNEYVGFEKFNTKVEDRHGMLSNLGVNKLERCTVHLCANLETTQSNLVPLLEKSNKIRFDTFFSIKKLEMNDFKYNGYVELEFKLNFGI